MPQRAKRSFGTLVGDKGYLSQPLVKQLYSLFDIRLITPRRKNMKKVERVLLSGPEL